MKRAVDVLLAGLALVLLSPLMLVAAAAIRLTMGPPVLFRHIRPGLHEQPFTLYKFRTMGEPVDADGRELGEAERVTPVGRLLRSTSIDETPQLWNVLRGDMSIVGPRPLLMEYLDAYSAEQRRRHEVRPGVTGYAQVKGRGHVDWDERLALDVYYVDHRSAWLDLKILLLTFRRLFDWREFDTPVVPFAEPAADGGSRPAGADARG